MSFISRIFTPPGTGAFVPPPTVPAVTPLPAGPAPPTAPTPPIQAQAPPTFSPMIAQQAAQRSLIGTRTATSVLGAAAAAGQTAKAKVLGT